MSGFWIKWEKGLTRKPEILQIAARLHIPATQAAGTLLTLMEWLDDSVLDLSADGHARVRMLSLNPDFIDGLVGVSGFAETLIEVGWVRVEGDEMVFVNAAKHNGISAKRRALDTERKRNTRSEKPSAKSPHPKRTKKGPLCSVSVSAISSVSEQIYAAYPRKQAHGAAIKAIEVALTTKPADFLLERTKAFAAATMLWPPSDLQFVPHPATWFNQQRYDDDPANWKRTNGNRNGNSRSTIMRDDYSAIG